MNTCPLTWPEQRRNLLLFACCTGLQYLSAPITYVGITQASLLKTLQATTVQSNLPATAYFGMTAAPALLAYLFPRVWQLKRNLAVCYGMNAFFTALMALILWLPAWGVMPEASFWPRLQINMVIIQAGINGIAMPAAIAFLWEVIGRGSEESKRGLALSLAFGAGPFLAVVGSLIQVYLLGGNLFGWEPQGFSHPWSYVTLYGITAPMLAFASFLATRFIVPLPASETTPIPWKKVAPLSLGLFLGFLALLLMQFRLDPAALARNEVGTNLILSGYAVPLTLNLGFWSVHIGVPLMLIAALFVLYDYRDILSQRIFLLATIVIVLLYAGNTIASNMNLYTGLVLGEEPEKFSGIQNTYRFSFKMIAGFFYGWLLTKTNPKVGLLVTGAIFTLAQFWTIFAPDKWFMIAFGIYGAGELVGAYGPNYLLSASKPNEMRRNMAFMTMLMAPAAPIGFLFGDIAQTIREENITWGGMTSSEFGFVMSFAVCAGVMMLGLLIALIFLPSQPGKVAGMPEGETAIPS
ncbi:MAG: hypothetical protein O2955_19590 [Planctomycetota bacterium]|nr:hypothetical protein [Planctomycetota bacterium]MDA1214717.1 hypothetical protein [Planctomycetota bacterium]